MRTAKLLVTTLLSLSLNAHAAFGGGAADTGGGNAVGDELLDLFENKGAKTINVTKVKAFTEVLVPIFNEIEQKIPGLRDLLLGVTKEKVWLLDPKPLSRKACINSSIIEVQKSVVGCQNKLEVRLSKTWFESKTVTIIHKAALILHELFRNQALKQKNMSDETVTFLTRTFMEPSKYSEDELAEVLKKTGMGIFATRSDVDRVNRDVVLPVYRETCTGTNREHASKASFELGDASERGFYGQISDFTDAQRAYLWNISNNDGFSTSYPYSEPNEVYEKRVCRTLSNYLAE